MAKENYFFDPENIMPKLQRAIIWLKTLFLKKKKLVLSLTLLLVVFLFVGYIRGRNTTGNVRVKTVATTVDKSFDFPALNNLGKPIGSAKVKFKITNAEKTNQVMVSDKPYVAKNDKLFLILHLEIKNDSTQSVNIFSGDLVRLSYDSEENKFAPDLHNNLVPVSAISTRIDRLGFVVPGNIKEFRLFIGELEGKKETVSVTFPS